MESCEYKYSAGAADLQNMKYKYSVVNNRLIPSDTTELVLAQELGRRFIYTEIICRACEDVDSRIQTLLNNAEKRDNLQF